MSLILTSFRATVVLALVVCVLAGGSADAADVNGDGYETILLPLALVPYRSQSGAFGTMWSGDVWVSNQNPFRVSLYDCLTICVYLDPSELGTVVYDESAYGYLLPAEASAAPGLTFSNRIWEQTLRAQPRGVDIPVVREGHFFSTEQTFLAVPSDDAVRVSVRVYDPWMFQRRFDGRFPGPALESLRVEVLVRPRRLLEQIAVTTLVPIVPNPGPLGQIEKHKPGFAAIHDLASMFPAIQDHEIIHIRVSPVPAGAQYWAMVSITDNETQTVSIITAQ